MNSKTLRSVVRGIGAYLPERVLTNAELAQTVDTSDEWIQQRTGIRQRHIAAPGETTSQLAVKAAEAALADAGLTANDIDLIIRGDIDARFHFSRRGHAGSGGARHEPWRRLRFAGGVFGIRLCGDDRRQISFLGVA